MTDSSNKVQEVSVINEGENQEFSSHAEGQVANGDNRNQGAVVSQQQSTELAEQTSASKPEPAQACCAEEVTDSQSPAACSERRLAANRRNAKKSTGPRTPEGKASSALNALKHGALAKKVLYDENGKLRSQDLAVLFQELCAEYDASSVRTRILIETLVASYRRCLATLDLENHVASRWGVVNRLSQEAARLHRYSVTNQRAMLGLLQQLHRIREEEGAAAAQAAALGTVDLEEQNTRDASASGDPGSEEDLDPSDASDDALPSPEQDSASVTVNDQPCRLRVHQPTTKIGDVDAAGQTTSVELASDDLQAGPA